MAATAPLQKPAGLIRAVRRWDLVALVINCIIGTGIFGLPSQAYALTGPYSLFAFIACGLVVVVVAITYAEVAGRFTGTGGAYLYVSEAFGPLVGFEVGWVTYLARVSSIGFACNVLVNYLSYFWPAAGAGVVRVAIMSAVMLLLTGINIVGVGRASVMSDIFNPVGRGMSGCSRNGPLQFTIWSPNWHGMDHVPRMLPSPSGRPS